MEIDVSHSERQVPLHNIALLRRIVRDIDRQSHGTTPRDKDVHGSAREA
jgi:hypothetical protein